jgi:hypothetical protein
MRPQVAMEAMVVRAVAVAAVVQVFPPDAVEMVAMV